MTGLILLGGYLLALLLAGARELRAGRDAAGFHVCGRTAGSGTVALSILASCVGGSATMGMTGLAWQVGTPAFWWLGAGAAGLLVLGLLLARTVRRSNAMTMPEVAAAHVGAPCRALASVIIVAAWLAILAAQLSALAAIMAQLAGLETRAALILGAGVLLAYTLAGGQAAVMRSDVWQFAALVLALVAALALLLHAGGGRALADARLELVNEAFPASRLRYFLCILGGSYVVCPMLFGRLLSARDATAARRGSLWAVAGLVLTACLVTALGLACRGLVPGGTAPEQVLGMAVAAHAPAWFAACILLGLFSAVISSADSCLFTAASVCANDILRRPGVRTCRLCMLALCAAAVVLALPGKGILALLLMANDIYVCGVVVPVLTGMLLPARLRLSPAGAACAMLGGGLLGLCAACTGNESWSFAGLLFAFAASVASIRLRPQGRVSQAGHGPGCTSASGAGPVPAADSALSRPLP